MNVSTVYHGYNISVLTIYLVWILMQCYCKTKRLLDMSFSSPFYSQTLSRPLAVQHSLRL